MKWESAKGGLFWYVHRVCAVEYLYTKHVWRLRRWGTAEIFGHYPTLEAAKLAAEIIFG